MAQMWPPQKGVAFTLCFTLYKNDGTVVANPGTYTKKVSIDGAAVANVSASVTEEDTTYGQLSLVLSTSEMNGDWIWVYVTDDTAGTVPFTCTLYTTAEYATTDDVADAVLNRDMDAVSDTNDRSPLNALRALRNKTSISGGTLTVTKEDDATEAWTATVTTDADAEPITVVNPV